MLLSDSEAVPLTLHIFPFGSIPFRLFGSSGFLQQHSLEAGPDKRCDASRLLPPCAVDYNGVQAPKTFPLQQGDEGLRGRERGEGAPRKGAGELLSKKIHSGSSTTATNPISLDPFLSLPDPCPCPLRQRGASSGARRRNARLSLPLLGCRGVGPRPVPWTGWRLPSGPGSNARPGDLGEPAKKKGKKPPTKQEPDIPPGPDGFLPPRGGFSPSCTLQSCR